MAESGTAFQSASVVHPEAAVRALWPGFVLEESACQPSSGTALRGEADQSLGLRDLPPSPAFSLKGDSVHGASRAARCGGHPQPLPWHPQPLPQHDGVLSTAMITVIVISQIYEFLCSFQEDFTFLNLFFSKVCSR